MMPSKSVKKADVRDWGWLPAFALGDAASCLGDLGKGLKSEVWNGGLLPPSPSDARASTVIHWVLRASQQRRQKPFTRRAFRKARQGPRQGLAAQTSRQV